MKNRAHEDKPNGTPTSAWAIRSKTGFRESMSRYYTDLSFKSFVRFFHIAQLSSRLCPVSGIHLDSCSVNMSVGRGQTFMFPVLTHVPVFAQAALKPSLNTSLCRSPLSFRSLRSAGHLWIRLLINNSHKAPEWEFTVLYVLVRSYLLFSLLHIWEYVLWKSPTAPYVRL